MPCADRVLGGEHAACASSCPVISGFESAEISLRGEEPSRRPCPGAKGPPHSLHRRNRLTETYAGHRSSRRRHRTYAVAARHSVVDNASVCRELGMIGVISRRQLFSCAIAASGGLMASSFGGARLQHRGAGGKSGRRIPCRACGGMFVGDERVSCSSPGGRPLGAGRTAPFRGGTAAGPGANDLPDLRLPGGEVLNRWSKSPASKRPSWTGTLIN